MTLVKEHIAFTREGEPLAKMGIGQVEVDRQFIANTDWGIDFEEDQIVDYIRNWKDWPILVVHDQMGYVAATVNNISSSSSPTADIAISKLKGKIGWYMEKNPMKKEVKRRMMDESQNFERTGEPIKQMSLGQKHIDQHIIDTTLWALRKEQWSDNQDRPFETNELIRNYRGFPILVLKDPNIDPKEESNMSAIWIATSTMSYTNWSSSKVYAIGRMKEIIDSMVRKGDVENGINQMKIKHGEPITEKLDFERGGEPMKQMDIGKAYSDRKIAEETDWFITFSHDDYDIVSVGEYMGYPIAIWKYLPKNKEDIYYVGTSTDSTGIGGRSADTAERALGKLEYDLEEWLNRDGATNEAQNFTRKGEPLTKMGIGREVRLKQLNSEIKWDWDARKYKDAVQEEVLDIVPHGKYFVKLSRMWYINGGDVTKKYFVTSNVEQDYPSDGPALHDSAEGLIEGEKKWMDEWTDSQ